MSPPCRTLFVCILLTLGMASAVRADSTVVFNEVMYHPPGNEELLEWVELHNQMAVDMDISAWSLRGGLEFTFPEGTIVKGGAYLLLARNPSVMKSITRLPVVYGPFTNRLSNS